MQLTLDFDIDKKYIKYPLTILCGEYDTSKDQIDFVRNETYPDMYESIEYITYGDIIENHYFINEIDIFEKFAQIRYEDIFKKISNVHKHKLPYSYISLLERCISSPNVYELYPEDGLYPTLQLTLADFFICKILSNKKVIIHTHSDHIINRIVRRIVEDKSQTIKDLIGIYYFKNENDKTSITKIDIGPHGITNWPDGFFDQTAKEQERIILASIDKRDIIIDG